MYEELLKAVKGLPEEYRLPVELHYFEGLSYDEIAEALDCPRGTVGTRLSRGTVVDPDGNPLQKGAVFLHLGQGVVAKEAFMGTTEALGRFTSDGIPPRDR